jgi:hypothetical protein
MSSTCKKPRGRLALVAVLVAAVTVGTVSTAEARPWHRHHHHRPPVATAPATPTVSPTPTPTASPSQLPADATFAETFDTPAAAGGAFARTYADSWQPYPDGTGGRYFSDPLISAHDGLMDVTLDGKRGAAGTFGTPEDAWSHVGGTFSIRAKATGGDGNGTAVMLWPTSNVWSDGEIDYPEGNFDDGPHVFHHSMVKGQEASAQAYDTGVSWRDWHTYTVRWVPGQLVRYYLDGDPVLTVTKNIPTAPHRFMFQTGDWGAPGHLLIDWVSTDEPEAGE